MSEIQVSRVDTEKGERLDLRVGAIELQWEYDGQLTLLHHDLPDTHVAGGILVESLNAAGDQRPSIHGIGREPDDALRIPERFDDVHGAGTLLSRSFPVAVQPLVVEITVRLYDDHEFIVLDVAIYNTGTAPYAIRRAFPFVTGAWWDSTSLRLEGQSAGFSVHKQGWQSWGFGGGVPPGHADPRPTLRGLLPWHSPGGRHPHQPVGGTADVASDAVALLGREGRPFALLAGFLHCERWFGQVLAQRTAGALATAVLLDDVTLQPGGLVRLPPVLLALGRQATLLSTYAEAVAREQRARARQAAPTGWCSWYYYFTNVTERDIHENLATLRTIGGALPVRVVQVDDGYQTAVGDWLSVADGFPHGMASLATRIREDGFRPGLWLAPFTVAANSRLAHEHSDWLVREAAGNPVYGGHNWGVELFGLDTSHPGARAWLRELIGTLVETWGYEYLKLDFLVSAALQGQRYDPAVTRAQALRDGLALIRESAGDSTYLLGCGCPLLSAVGLVDGMRIGPDAAPHWRPERHGMPVPFAEGHVGPTMQGALRNTLTRAWMHPALWTNDPDCLIAREQGSDLTTDEVRAFASAVGLTGGMVLVSDRLAHLTLERLGLLTKLLPPLAERAQPLDYFGWGVPTCVFTQIVRPWGESYLVGLFNAAEHEAELAVSWAALGLAPGDYHSVEFWTETYHGRASDGVSVRVGPHGAAVLAVRPVVDVPQLLSTSFHIGQGAAEVAEWDFDAEQRTVRWHVRLGRRDAGTMTIWMPSPWIPRSLTSTALTAIWRIRARGELTVSAEIQDEAWFTLELEHER